MVGMRGDDLAQDEVVEQRGFAGVVEAEYEHFEPACGRAVEAVQEATDGHVFFSRERDCRAEMGLPASDYKSRKVVRGRAAEHVCNSSISQLLEKR